MATTSLAPKRSLKIKLPTRSREVSCNETQSGKKRGRPNSEQIQPEKKLKMDRSMSQQCSTLIKFLICQPEGWVFKDPVDPVELGIPDYFSIIKKPMDLGTIKSKLDRNLYKNVEEFVDDVHLTFSNAILYNPPTNSVHRIARKLNDVFDSRCRSLIAPSQKSQCKNSRPKLHTVIAEEANTQEQRFPKTPVHRSVGFKKFSNFSKPKVVKSTKSSKPNFFRSNFTQENLVEEIKCDPSISCGLDSKTTKCDTKSKPRKSDLESDVSAIDEEAVNCPVTADALPTEGCESPKSPCAEMLLSPSKALRAAMLKQRFADTILKAQNKILHEHCDASGPAKIRLEKERLEKKQLEDWGQIEAQLKAAEAASKMKEELQRKNKRQQEREAARIALQKMQKTAGIEVNSDIVKELEMLRGGALVYSPRGQMRYELDCSLEKLGLFIKDDDCDDCDDDEPILEREEGEILH